MVSLAEKAPLLHIQHDDDDYTLLDDSNHVQQPYSKNNLPQEYNNDPFFFRTTTRRLLSMCLLFLLLIIASGPVLAFLSLEQLFVKYNVLLPTNTSHASQATALSDIYNIGLGVGLSAFFFLGPLYDWLGAKWFGPVGALLGGVGLIGMWAAVHFKQYNYLLYYAYPIAVTGSFTNGMALYGYVWLFPHHQTVILGIASSATLISDTAPYFINLLDKKGISAFPDTLFILGIAAGVVSILSIPFCPTKTFEFECAARHNNHEIHKPQVPNFMVLMRRTVDTIKVYPVSYGLFLFWCISVWVTLLNWATNLFYLENKLFGNHTADQITDDFALIYGFAGFLASISFGALCDGVGLKHFFTVILIFYTTAFALSLDRALTVQWISTVLLTMALSGFILIMPRFCISFAAPDLFGFAFGFITAVLGLANLAFGPLITSYQNTLPDTPQRYMQFTELMLAACVLPGVILRLVWIWHPPPEPGSVEL
eukprot:m.343939 g.343939  ORF g.343939 m.343939 type:complete len:482 (-) comp23587_c0_seq1:231-1676(-)